MRAQHRAVCPRGAFAHILASREPGLPALGLEFRPVLGNLGQPFLGEFIDDVTRTLRTHAVFAFLGQVLSQSIDLLIQTGFLAQPCLLFFAAAASTARTFLARLVLAEVMANGHADLLQCLLADAGNLFQLLRASCRPALRPS